MNKDQAQHLLQVSLNNPSAQFREGQFEAIDALVNRQQKLLVVQRTGWGKSSVYFISCKILRDQNQGPTIIVSPLLALMRNQIESAKRLGIEAVTINSSNVSHWSEIKQQILNNQIDCLLISPERLANDNFIETLLQPIANTISLMVIDEAHCISDWGHDFRPDYRRIVNILRYLPQNIPVLGTTATANDNVVADICTQLGNIEIQRGPLIRESLALQSVRLSNQADRLAWIAQTIPTIQGTGIIYTLTTRDAEQVARWLQQNNISAAAYHGSIIEKGFSNSNEYRQYLENKLLNNELKVLVATTALGMGYDKPDLSFVIHYQTPSSIVAYYQQVGRAGRGISSAIGILISGAEDKHIHQHFRDGAFPSEAQVNQILTALEQSDGLTIRDIEQQTNLRHSQIEKVLKLLNVENPAPIIKNQSKWQRTPVPYQMDEHRINHLTEQREQEWYEIQHYIDYPYCKMNFLKQALNDQDQTPCGKCTSCIGAPIVELLIDQVLLYQATVFLQHSELTIELKKQVAANAFPQYGFKGNLPQKLRAQPGKALARWGDAGWGQIIVNQKREGHFNDELVTAMAEMILKRWQPNPAPQWLCYVPSIKNPTLVPDFAYRLANHLNLPLYQIIDKVKDNQPQYQQHNRFYQCNNLDGAFAINQTPPNTPVLLVDDIIDSGWTLTVLAALLLQAGSGMVYPVALASLSVAD